MAKEKKEAAAAATPEKTPDKSNDREYLVRLATNFLTNPKTQAGSKESKVKFLKEKGLKPDEIERAFQNAEKKKKEEEEEKAKAEKAAVVGAQQTTMVQGQVVRTGPKQPVLPLAGRNNKEFKVIRGFKWVQKLKREPKRPRKQIHWF